MVCIFCDSGLDVTNSRPNKRTNQVWRRRHCQNCGADFTTYEKVDYHGAWRVKTNQKLLPFDWQLLFVSIYESCKHRPSPIADASALTETVVTLLGSLKVPVFEREQIVVATTATLQNFDSAAAVQYSAFHRPTTKTKS